MNKGIKITLLTLGSIIAVGGGAVLAFGGKPFVTRATQEYPDTDALTATPYPYGDRAVPADYVPLTRGAWTVSAPAELVCAYKDGDSAVRKRFYTAEYGTDGRVGLVFMDPYAFGELDLTGGVEKSKVGAGIADYVMRSYAKKLGYPMDSWYTLYDLCYHLTSKDAGSSLRNGMGYYLFACLKDETVLSDAWEFHTDTADGFIQINYAAEDSSTVTPYGAVVDLFPRSDRNTAHDLIIKASDEDTLINMINSLQFDPTKAEGADS
jgi:hypothetical protein